jgi:hypothetical protein
VIHFAEIWIHKFSVHGRVLNTPASYSQGLGFKPQHWRPAILIEVFSWFYSVPPGECHNSNLKLGHERFQPNPFQVIIIHLSPYHRCCTYNIVTEKCLELPTNQPTRFTNFKMHQITVFKLTLHSRNFVWKPFTLSYMDVMNLFSPWRFRFNSFKCFVMSTINARFRIHFLLLMFETSCSFISENKIILFLESKKLLNTLWQDNQWISV